MSFNKYILVFFILFGSIISVSQIKTIKIKKDETCNFKLIADSSVNGKVCLLSKFAFNMGIKKRDANYFRKKMRLVTGMQLSITQDYFIEKFQEICESKKLKLDSVQVKKNSYHYPNDSLINYVVLIFNYKKKS